MRRDLVGTWPVGGIVSQGCHASVSAIWAHKDHPHTLDYCSPNNLDSMHKNWNHVECNHDELQMNCDLGSGFGSSFLGTETGSSESALSAVLQPFYSTVINHHQSHLCLEKPLHCQPATITHNYSSIPASHQITFHCHEPHSVLIIDMGKPGRWSMKVKEELLLQFHGVFENLRSARSFQHGIASPNINTWVAVEDGDVEEGRWLRLETRFGLKSNGWMTFDVSKLHSVVMWKNYVLVFYPETNNLLDTGWFAISLRTELFWPLQVTLEVKGEPQLVNLSENLTADGIAHKLWTEQPENYQHVLRQNLIQTMINSLHDLINLQLPLQEPKLSRANGAYQLSMEVYQGTMVTNVNTKAACLDRTTSCLEQRVQKNLRLVLK
ncbi:hypothetical protein RJ641_022038 [Dillenia turbinata]|uniref:Uncharacterized protein n=1 Tax=Dillenia turbinata TaxID=194707 RepID=A0AAN8YTU4_9MAGN